MKSISWRAANLATAAVLVPAFVATQPLLASSPFGIYAIIDKVVFEPDESASERIQISKSGVVAPSDVYPLGIGIVKMTNEGNVLNPEEVKQRSILTQLKEAHNAQ